jgi:hypothetical protein
MSCPTNYNPFQTLSHAESQPLSTRSRVFSPQSSLLFLTIIMSSRRPSKMHKIAGSLQERLSSLRRLSRAPTPSLLNIDLSSDNDIATTNAGTR